MTIAERGIIEELVSNALLLNQNMKVVIAKDAREKDRRYKNSADIVFHEFMTYLEMRDEVERKSIKVDGNFHVDSLKAVLQDLGVVA